VEREGGVLDCHRTRVIDPTQTQSLASTSLFCSNGKILMLVAVSRTIGDLAFKMCSVCCLSKHVSPRTLTYLT
jgi:hypothetical protein